MLSRFIKATALAFTAFGLAIGVAIPAQAQTSWNWTDLSNQVTYRTNRPVWAMAYANGSWFFTDGQDLWNGGQVYRFDGTSTANITTNVRNAGLSRVDDIVSDGQSILFLKNMTPRNNQFEAVTYQNGTYTNISYTLRSAFSADEGIGFISGRNGEWYITTSKARALHWYGGRSTPTALSLPSGLQTNLTNAYLNASLPYSVSIFPYNNATFRVVPISGNQWLFVFANSFYQTPAQYTTQSKMYRYDGTTFTDLSSNLHTSGNYTVQGNGNDAVVIYSCASCVRVYGHGIAREYLLVDSTGVRSYSSSIDLYGKPIWTGREWAVLNEIEKHITLISESTVQDLGEMADYFVTGASNNNGTILFGGTASTYGVHQPSSPLTARLLRVTESSVSTPTPTPAYPSDFRMSAWTDPATNVIANNQSITYTVNAQSGYGLQQTDIYVNGVLKRTCNWYGSTANQSCSFSIYGGNYNYGGTVTVSARATDNQNRVAWTSPLNLTVTNGTVVTQPSTQPQNPPSWVNVIYDAGNGIRSWAWLQPNVSSLSGMENATYNVGASDANGINRIEIVVNGITVRTCNLGNAKGNQGCAFTLVGNDYAKGTNIAFNAKIVDGTGRYTWTPLMSVAIPPVSYSTYPTYDPEPISNGIAPTTWIWTNPSDATRVSSATFNVGAWDANGVNRIEIWVNGINRNTCNTGNTTGNTQCSATISPSNYPVGTNVFANAKVVDGNGMEIWTASKSWYVDSSTVIHGL